MVLRKDIIRELRKLPREALINLIINELHFVKLDTVLYEHWDFLAKSAMKMRDDAITLSKGEHFGSSKYQKSVVLWDKAEKISKQANDIWTRLESCSTGTAKN